MTWFVCVDKTFSLKTHFANSYLSSRLIEALENREDETTFTLDEKNSRLEGKISYELGGYGMYALNQPRHTFDIGGNLLEIDDQQAQEWMTSLKDAKRRTFADGTEYIKLYSRFSCLVLTQEERESLLFQIKGKLPEMNAASDEFLEKFEESWAKMTKDNGGVPPIIRLKDLEPDKPKN